MGDRTPRYALYKLAPGESLRAEGDAFIRGNIDTIEQLLYLGVEGHHHTGVGDEVDAPSIPNAEIESGGTLPLSSRFYYRVAHVVAGVESPASDEVAVDTPADAASPALPAAAVHQTGGTLVGGNYYYALSAYEDFDTQETAAPNVQYVPVPFITSTNRVVLTLPPLPAQASGFNVYRRRPSTSALVLVGTIDMTVGSPPATFIDDGTLTENVARTQPRVSSIPTTTAIRVTPQTVPTGVPWRLYRSDDPGDWGDSFLAQVAAGVTDFVDTGAATTAGVPVEVGNGVGTPPKVLLTDQAEVEGRLAMSNVSGFPVDVPMGFDGTLTVGPGEGVWVCPYPQASIVGVTLSLGRGTAATGDVEVDILKGGGLTPTYATVFSAPTGRPKVLTGNQIGATAVPLIADRELVLGDSLVADIVADGGENLTVIVHLIVYGWTGSTSHPWAP